MLFFPHEQPYTVWQSDVQLFWWLYWQDQLWVVLKPAIMQTWSVRNNIKSINIWKPRYHYQKSARAVPDCAPKKGRLNSHAPPPSPPSGIKRRVTTVCLLETRTSVSTSVDTSLVPEQPGTSPTGAEYKITEFSLTSMRAPTACKKILTLWDSRETTFFSAKFRSSPLKRLR